MSDETNKQTPPPLSHVEGLTRLSIRLGGEGIPGGSYAFTEADDEGDYVFFTDAIAALRHQDLMGWQDISTAPKDGRDLLLTSQDWNGDAVVGSFAFGEWRKEPSPEGETLVPDYWMSIPPLNISAPQTRGATP